VVIGETVLLVLFFLGAFLEGLELDDFVLLHLSECRCILSNKVPLVHMYCIFMTNFCNHFLDEF
jgi:hypothetical protein